MTDPSTTITRCPQAGTPEPGCSPVAGAVTTVARALAAPDTACPSRCPPGGWPSPRVAPSWPAGTGPYRRVAAGRVSRPLRAGPGGLDGTGGVEGGCLRSRAAGQPAPSAGSRAGRRHPRQRRGRAGGDRPGPRARPCRPSPSGRSGPPTGTRPAAQAARAAPLLSPFPRSSPRRPAASAGPAGAGLDAAGGAEPSSTRTHRRAAPGDANRPRPARRHPGRGPQYRG